MKRYGNPPAPVNADHAEIVYRVGGSSIRCTTWRETVAAEVKLLSPRQRSEVRKTMREVPINRVGRTRIALAAKFGVSVAAIKKVEGQ